jgi:DNA modification methylase
MLAWEQNPRFSTVAQAKRIIESEKKFNQVVPFIVAPFNADGKALLYDGHQRASAWLTVYGPEKTMDAMQADRELTDEEHRELIVTLHAGATGAWDWNQLSAWDTKELQEWGFDKSLLKEWNTDATNLKELLNSEQETIDAEPQIDRAAELLEKWGVKTGDLWKIGNHKLLCGDSTKREDVKRVMDGDKASLIWTDPPYGVSYGDKLEEANPMGYRVRQIENDNLPSGELEIFLRSALKNVAEFSVSGAAIYVACPPGTPLPALIASFAGSGFEYRWGLVWLKDQIVLSRADYHFKHENILYGWKPDGAHYFTDDRTQSSVFEYPRPKKSEEHPTMKPVGLVQHMIRNSSEKGNIVCDVFGGSGTTMIASENEKRLCRMIELSPAFSSVVLERMATAFPELAIERVQNGH